MVRNAVRRNQSARTPVPVAATSPVAADLLADAGDVLDITRFDISGWGQAAFVENLRGFPGILVSLRTPLNRTVLEGLANELRVISSFTAGVENIDLKAADRLGIAVANTGSVVAVPTAEITMLLILATMRRVGPSIELIRGGAWKGLAATPPAGAELSGKALGIVGLGGIGSEVPRRAGAFGMTVLYHNRRPAPTEREQDAQYVDTLAGLLGQADVISLNCPLTVQTREMINPSTLALMKPGAVLINAARGELLDETAVIGALESGQMSALGLDVYTGEPDVNPYFLGSDKVFTLPHLGTATPESRRGMQKHALDNLVRYFSGKQMKDVLVAGR